MFVWNSVVFKQLTSNDYNLLHKYDKLQSFSREKKD